MKLIGSLLLSRLHLTALGGSVKPSYFYLDEAHNFGTSTITFPGRMEACITVGATDSDDTRSSFSNYGSAIDLVSSKMSLIAAHSSSVVTSMTSSTHSCAILNASWPI